MSSQQRWTFTAGERGYRVTVYEREPGGPLYARCWDEARHTMRRVSLGTASQKEAKRYAVRESAALQAGQSQLKEVRRTLLQVITLYRQEKSPKKGPAEQQGDARRAALWLAQLGEERDPHTVMPQTVEKVLDARRSGAIDARGLPVAEADRRPVRATAAGKDAQWLGLVYRWACRWYLEPSKRLMQSNPLDGFTAPKEKNIRRPVASTERYAKLRAVAEQVPMEERWHGKRDTRPSYLPELLDLAHGTGRRINAICSLRVEDLRFEPASDAPDGAIRWPASTDKQGRETTVAISSTVRAALKRRLGALGRTTGPLFPSPTDPERPITKDRALKWLRAAEKLAELEHLPRGGFHMLRRGFASARRHLPLVDLAKAGGWSGTETLTRCYLHADPAGVLAAVNGAMELREVRGA